MGTVILAAIQSRRQVSHLYIGSAYLAQDWRQATTDRQELQIRSRFRILRFLSLWKIMCESRLPGNMYPLGMFILTGSCELDKRLILLWIPSANPIPSLIQHCMLTGSRHWIHVHVSWLYLLRHLYSKYGSVENSVWRFFGVSGATTHRFCIFYSRLDTVSRACGTTPVKWLVWVDLFLPRVQQ